MLSRSENKVMGAIYAKCRNKKAVLIEQATLLSEQGGLSEERLDKIVNDLYVDGFYDLVYTDRHGERVYCITLTEKGKGYPREAKLIRRTLTFRLIVSVGFAVFSFVLGLILKAIFS